MVRRPKLKSHLSAEIVGPSLAVLLSDVDHWMLEGPVYSSLLPLVDGTRSVADIVAELRGRVNIGEALAALMILERSGYLADESETPGGMPTRISVTSFGLQPLDPAARILEMLGFTVDTSAELTLVVTDEYLRHEIADFALQAQHANRPWLPVKPAGTLIWLGPLVHPPATPCWHCVLNRVRANRPVHAWLESRGDLATPRAMPIPSTLHLALHAASLQVVKWARRPRAFESRVRLITIDPDTLRSERHELVRQPGCTQCGPHVPNRGPGSARDARIVLESRARIRSADGGWRILPPEKTFRRYKHHISKITGVVSQLRRQAVGSGALELYSADHVFAPAAENPFPTGRRVSAGKGISRVQARTSALCEALERYSGVFRGDEPRIRASYEALADSAIQPNACANFSDAQFERREVWNAQRFDRTWVPTRLNLRQPTDWTPVWSLTHDAVRYIPTAYCYYGYRDGASEPCCRADSNGCAAGNSLEEAILQGFLELVERDAAAIWWYNEMGRPAVDLTTFSHSFFRRMITDYSRGGRSLDVLDLTTDLGIPVFAALSTTPKSNQPPLLVGFGAHFDAQTAIARAITELNQWRCGVELGAPGSGFSDAGGRPGEFLRRSRSQAIRGRNDFELADHGDIRDAVRSCVERAARCGLDTLVLDQTREDVGLSVVRVIVPGLRHFWPRFGPGRLYDVPVDLGWLSTVKTENELNSSHILI